MGRFINPFTDYGFKKIFGQEISKPLLIDFLNDLLVGERHITGLTFLNNERLPEGIDDRGVIYDIYCETDTGEKIVVEMQNCSQAYFRERALYYLAKDILQQGEVGKGWLFDLKAVYGVFFMNFNFGDSDTYRTDVILADRETGKLFSDKLRQVFICLPKFKKEESDCETDFERWIYILKNMDTLKRLPFQAQKAVLTKLEEIAEVSSLTKEERRRYENSLDDYRTNLAVYAKAQQDGWEVGRIKGHAEGHAEGLVEGRAKGLTEGRAEGHKMAALSTAQKMKRKGFSMEDIMEITGLSSEEIATLPDE